MRPYLKGGKPIHRKERTNDCVFSIVVQFQQEFRDIAELGQVGRKARPLAGTDSHHLPILEVTAIQEVGLIAFP
jgi:hypothetical protein